MRSSSYRAALVALTAGLLAAPAALSAQVHFIVGGGLSSPSGTFSDLAKPGYHGRLGLQIGLPLLPLAVRVEGDVNRFPAKAPFVGTETISDGTASAVLSLGGVGVSPYAIAGLGVYSWTAKASVLGLSASTTSAYAGYHIGLGLSFGILGFGGIVEGRFVDVATPGKSLHYFPLTVALRF